MSSDDCIWYGRVGVWIGIGVLLLMAITARSLTFLAVLSVLAILVGLVLLVYGLWLRSHDDALSPTPGPSDKTASHA